MTLFRRVVPALAFVLLAGWAVPGRSAEAVKLLPSDTEAVVTVNVKQLLAAPLVEKLLGKVKDRVAVIAELQKAQEEIGLDPLRDIDRVMLAMGSDARSILVLVQGKFNPEKIRAKAPEVARNKKDILKIVQAGGHTLYEVKPPQENKPFFVAVCDETLVVVSNHKDSVVEALDRFAGRRNGALKKDMAKLLATADSKHGVLIHALPGPLAVTGQPLVDKIQTIVGHIDVRDDVRLELTVNTRNAKDAKSLAAELAENLDQVKALVENAAQVDNRLQPFVDTVGSLRAVSEGNSVILTGQLSREVIGTIQKMFDK